MRWVSSVPLMLALVCLSSGCSGPTTPGEDPAGPGQAGAAESAAELEAAVARACSLGACSDRFARVTAWRDAKGELRVLVHEGSLESCSHPPMTYVSAEGERLLDQANRPVVDAADGARFEAERATLLEGLTADPRTHRCP